MSEVETITGTLDGITEKPSGWTEIQVRVEGWQYPVKMATKLEPLIELARAAGTDEMEWTFKKTESDQINPHSGKPFVNRYFEGVAPLGTNGTPAPRDSGKGTGHPPSDIPAGRVYTPDLKDRMIVRQTCLKAAAVAVGRFPIDTEDPILGCMKAAQRFETWVYRDIDSPPSDAGRPPLTEHDDGIPF